MSRDRLAQVTTVAPSPGFSAEYRTKHSSATYLVPLASVMSLFFLWAIGVHFNDILIPHLKGAFKLNDFQSSWIQTAFFGGYCVAALPASRFAERHGYKRGMIAGLLTCAAGAVMFLPAAMVHAYPLFLLSLFTMACGQSFLEVAANPYVALLGPPQKSALRLNLAQAFNAAGAVLTPILGAAFIFGPVERTALSAHRVSEVKLLAGPYIGLTLVYLLFAFGISRVSLPEIQSGRSARYRLVSMMRFPQLMRGVLAQFFYVGAQVGVASFIIRLAEYRSPLLQHSTASQYLRYHLLAFLGGRILGSLLLQRISPSKLLAAFAVAAIAASSQVMFAGAMFPVWAAVMLGLCNSIMFPTIFALSIQGLGDYTKLGSSLLIMAILGGALLPPVMGLISDRSCIQYAFAVPCACYFVVLLFALFSRTSHAAIAERSSASGTVQSRTRWQTSPN
jgi:FHS family L-fucose permease-like MFS transporter